MIVTLVIVLVIILCIFLLGMWIYSGFGTIQPDEMGIKVTLGVAGESVGSGIYFVLRPFQKIKIYPRTPMRFEFTVPSIMTKAGYVDGYEGRIDSTTINLPCQLVAYFDEFELKKAASNAPGNSALDLGPILVPYLIDAIRAVVGSMPWRLTNQEREKLTGYVLARVDPDREYYDLVRTDEPRTKHEKRFKFSDSVSPTKFPLDPANPFFLYGIKRSLLSLNFEDVNFNDPEMDKALNAAEKSNLNARSTVTDSIAQKQAKKNLGDGDAYARGEMIKKIKDHADLELLYSLREMAKGTSNTILYQIPSAFEDKMKNILGGNKPEDLIKYLSGDDGQKLIKELIEKLK